MPLVRSLSAAAMMLAKREALGLTKREVSGLAGLSTPPAALEGAVGAGTTTAGRMMVPVVVMTTVPAKVPRKLTLPPPVLATATGPGAVTLSP